MNYLIYLEVHVVFQMFVQHTSPDFISGPAECLGKNPALYSLSVSDCCVCVCAYTPMCTVWYRGRGECCSVTLSYSLVT